MTAALIMASVVIWTPLDPNLLSLGREKRLSTYATQELLKKAFISKGIEITAFPDYGFNSLSVFRTKGASDCRKLVSNSDIERQLGFVSIKIPLSSETQHELLPITKKLVGDINLAYKCIKDEEPKENASTDNQELSDTTMNLRKKVKYLIAFALGMMMSILISTRLNRKMK